MFVHASCAARGNDAVLLLGPPGAGKSDLVLRLLQAGWCLVADDQVSLQATGGEVTASAPDALRGLLEVRGLGIFRDLPSTHAALRLAVELVPRDAVPRLPEPRRWHAAGLPTLPLVALHGFDAAAPARIAMALDAATGRVRQQAGAFA
ncbi:aldolase [Roseomonas sp. NAR14]|uniref:Aldolase n=1 Tax=Roseomonas acroporae TaxID=2937791 RepID=A0A9X2BT65_9PROT|nr:aldolase [Roseomonas acroporae]MCK8783897.1 aldolase [Roseomonas acroporae]